ncbi:MAG: hypothetical protein DSZ08_05620 [Sulfurovum sp.]|nr:MAG: hypothetical protein DSZ08_05620 [Sulfurovum sp.]
MKNKCIKNIYLILSLWLLTATIYADEQEKNMTIEPHKFYNTFMPILATNPTYGTMYGVAASSGIYLGDIATTKMSNIAATATYTSKHQKLFTLKGTGYSENNEWMILGDARLFYTSQSTYGLGTGPLPNGDKQSDSTYDKDAQLMDFDMYRIHLTGLKQIKPSFYIGLGYKYDKYSNIIDTDLNLSEEGKHLTSHYIYSMAHGFDTDSYTLSGVSLDAIYDTRDNVSNPYTGRYAYASFSYYPEFLGSDKKSSTLWLEYRDYYSMDKQDPRKLLALWSYANFVTSGDMPYMDLPAVGWDQYGRSGRAYTQGRFRGEDIFYTELEYRIPLKLSKKHPKRYGMTLFANVTSTSDKARDQKLFDYLEPAAGIGFRIMVNEQSRANIAIDYAVGVNGKGSVYLNINEAF